MTSQLDSRIVDNRVETVLESSKSGKAYIRTALGRKLAQRKISPAFLASVSETSRADVSYYLRGRLNKIGKTRKRRITNVLCGLGIIKRRNRKPPQCRCCGVTYPTQCGKRDVN